MNKKDIRWGVLILVFGLFVIPLLLKLPAFWSVFDYSESNNLATAISGFTAPVLSLISIILIFMAFREQRVANDILRIQNNDLTNQAKEMKSQRNIDFTFRLIEQLNSELSSITYRQSNSEHLSRGSNAVHAIGKLTSIGRFPLTQYNDIRKVVSLTRSFLSIEKFINETPIDQKTRSIFRDKMNDWFYSNLSSPLSIFREGSKTNNSAFDPDMKIIIDLIDRMEPTGQQQVDEFVKNL